MELSEIRKEIDRVDDGLLALFLERMDLAEQVAAAKQAQGLPILNKERERAVLARVTAAAGERERGAFQLYSTLFALARQRQAELLDLPTPLGDRLRAALAAETDLFPQTGSVACQGTEGGNSQAACDRLLPRGNIMYVKSFEAVFGAVESDLCRFGVLPVENSTNGSVRQVYALLTQRNAFIVRSARLNIRHCLLALPGANLGEIDVIYSHQQALGQCSRFLGTLPGVRTVACANTAEAARLVAESGNRRAAAIAAPGCAALYGLSCLRDDIMDSDNNYTRFVCIAREPAVYAGADRISLAVSCDNQPGALYSLLGKLAALGINMTKLESCPVVGSDFEFLFFLELEADPREPGVLPMLEALARDCRSARLLGCYREV